MDNNASLESLLSEINPDYRAWLTIYDTNIDYPVMQGEDDLFYASRDIYKEVSLTGSIYLAAANTNGRLVVMYVATRRNLITVDALGQTWTYDGQAHTLTDLSDDNSGVYYTTNYPGDDDYPTTVEYSIDDGVTWTTEPPTVTNVSESTDVIVRVTNDAYGRATVTVYLFLPLLHLGAKYDRARLMSKVNKNKRLLRLLPARNEDETWEKGRLIQLIQEAREKAAGAGGAAATGDPEEGEFSKAVDTLFYQAKRFRHRFSFGVFLELIFSAVAVIAFILTEDMRLPMTLIDKWTPLMILLMVIVWGLDVVFIRYRRSVLADEEDAERRRLEREQAARNGQ